MPAYNSAWNADRSSRIIGNIALLPLNKNTKVRGPAEIDGTPDVQDIIHEALDLFRANCFFKNFEIKGPADRLLIYIIMFTTDCLSRVSRAQELSKQDCNRQLTTFALESFALPGDATFPLNSTYSPPANRIEADELRQYLSQVRQELVIRLTEERLYPQGTETKPSKWWIAFQRRKFMGKSLAS